MQEDALVAFDATEEIFIPGDEGGYGRETDWWSLGIMVYELVYGVTPFFAKDIRRTYDRITNHQVQINFFDIVISTLIHLQRSLKFDPLAPVSPAFRHLLQGYTVLFWSILHT